jgi:trk system potassium uptake protein TrkA
MKVVIVGAGEVGYHIADRLSREGQNVALIEKNPDKVRTLASKLNALVVQGIGSSAEVLEEVEIQDANLFIAVTDQDEVNLISCMLANEYGVPKIVSRIRNIEYAGDEWAANAKKLGIDLLINPQMVVAKDLVEVISYPAATSVAEFADGRIVFLGYHIGSDNPLAGITLMELGQWCVNCRFVVAALSRMRDTIIPRGNDTIMAGDILYFLCLKKELESINYIFGFARRRVENIMILGGGWVGEGVARELNKKKLRVKILDRNRDRCERLAQNLADVIVIHADGTDVDILHEEGIKNIDVFVAVTQEDESNILCSLLAKSHGANRAIALVNQPQYVSLAPIIGVDACISPRLSTAGAILKYVRRGEVLSMAMVEECEAEVIELILPESSRILGKPLKEIQVPHGAIIGALVRAEEVIIPGGEDQLAAGDRAVIFTLPEAVPRVEEFFS